MEGYGWFANVIFHDQDEPKKQYAIDFWFKPRCDKLTLMLAFSVGAFVVALITYWLVALSIFGCSSGPRQS
jgi:hypothetical protein